MIVNFVLVVVRRTRDWSHFFNQYMIHRRYVSIYVEKVNHRVGYRGLFHLVGPLAPDMYYLFRVH